MAPSRASDVKVDRVRRGTTKILLVDFLAAMAVTTFGLLYAKVSPVYLVLLASITFCLFFLVSVLLVRSDQYVRSQVKPS